ncbi:hypothetical protein GQ457_09G012430 [Hibiscus cannabinus]
MDGKISISELRRRLRQMGGEMALNEEDVGIEAMGLEDVMELMEGMGEEEKMKDLRFYVRIMNINECFVCEGGRSVYA